MEMSFQTKKLTKTLNSEREVIKKFGPVLGRIIMRRLAVLEAADNLNDVPETAPTRRHPLHHNREGQYAINADDQTRIIFTPTHNPLPKKKGGGLNLKKITSITIIEVEDYH